MRARLAVVDLSVISDPLMTAAFLRGGGYVRYSCYALKPYHGILDFRFSVLLTDLCPFGLQVAVISYDLVVSVLRPVQPARAVGRPQTWGDNIFAGPVDLGSLRSPACLPRVVRASPVVSGMA